MGKIEIQCGVLHKDSNNSLKSNIWAEVYTLKRFGPDKRSVWGFKRTIDLPSWLELNLPLMDVQLGDVSSLVSPSLTIDPPYYHEFGYTHEFLINEYEKAIALMDQSRRMVEDFLKCPS